MVSETDPWFDQGASATLFGGRFRNFVVARCRGQGLTLSAEELDLIDSWFAGATPTAQVRPALPPAQPAGQPAPAQANGPARWWPNVGQRPAEAPETVPAGVDASEEDFPRIVRTRR